MYPETPLVVQLAVTGKLLMFAPDGAAVLLASCHPGLQSDASKWQYGISPPLSGNLPHKWMEKWGKSGGLRKGLEHGRNNGPHYCTRELKYRLQFQLLYLYCHSTGPHYSQKLLQ